MSSTDTSVSPQEMRDYLRELSNAPRYLHVVCLRCGLIVDRRRKSTDLRTPEELFERVQCGNCCARSVHGEVIFSFDGGLTFYDYEAVIVSNARSLIDTAASVSSLPTDPARAALGTLSPVSEWSELATNVTELSSSFFNRLKCIPWGEAAMYAALGVFALAVLLGLRTAVYVYAAALGG